MERDTVWSFPKMATTSQRMKEEKIAIVGSGLIGRSFAMLFASAEFKVSLYDKEPTQISGARIDIERQLTHLQEEGLLRGHLTVEQQLKQIRFCTNLKECVEGATYIHECVPERLDLKTSVYAAVDQYVGPQTILATSASALVPSLLSKNVTRKNRFIVVHPTNPPFYAPLVELVPAPWTDTDVVHRTKALMEQVGQAPVVLNKEIEGFVLNRLQYAIIGECWRLINDDIISIQDLDKVMSCGLGTRYAFMGPMETAYLNADGMLSYADRYADMIYGIQKTFGAPIKMEGDLLHRIQAEMERYLPLDKLRERRRWRDIRLSELARLKLKDSENNKK